MGSIRLKSGRENSVLRRHPWIFPGAIAGADACAQPGETVEILAADGRRLGRGAFSPHSQIRVRIWSFQPDEPIGPAFFENRLARAVYSRQLLKLARTCSGYRIVNAESDGLPGLIVDRYDDFLVCQFLSAGAEYWKTDIVGLLNRLIPASGIYERSDTESRTQEGLGQTSGVLFGAAPPDRVEIREGPIRYRVDIAQGHKTGFYLDQRENRALVPGFSKDADVLNCFSYTGGFGLWALYGGAKTLTNIELSKSAAEISRQNIDLNGMDAQRVEHSSADVFSLLRKYRDAMRQFDLAILDPPKFAHAARQIDRAARGYKDINLLALKLIRPGGVLFTFSCSGHVAPMLFQKIVADAAQDAGREVQILRHLNQSADHPVGVNFPEGHYLKGLVCRVW